MKRRLFTLEEANQLVPWLERTFQRLNSSMGRMETLKGRLSELQRVQLRLNGTFGRYNEMNSMQSELEEMGKELQGIVDDIVAEGIIIRDIPRGLVDFPHLREGREVYLCWVSGEQSIDFWHETNRGFDHREPL
jgi:hypothetical protein